MTNAYYPNQIRSWTTHRNTIDTIDAAHVNNLQAELRAVMATLGQTPHIYNDVEAPYEIPQVVLNDTGGVSTDDSAFTPATRHYDPRTNPINHGSVSARLDSIERGRQQHVFELKASGVTTDPVTSKYSFLTQRPPGVRFPAPATSSDPFGYYNGVGITLRKAGFWIFTGAVEWSPQVSSHLSATIDVDGSYRPFSKWRQNYYYDSNSNDTLHPLRMGFFNLGAQVTLRTANYNFRSGRKILSASLAGVCLRESL